MARPKKQRIASAKIKETMFAPQGLLFGITDLKGDELEAMRLCDKDELYQERAARRMGVSRRTLERMLFTGRKKVTDALLNSKAIQISIPEYLLMKGKG